MVTFDPAKNAANIAARGLSFDRANDLDWATAVIETTDAGTTASSALSRPA